MNSIQNISPIRVHGGPSYSNEELKALRSTVASNLEKIAAKEKEVNAFFIACIKKQYSEKIVKVLRNNGKLPEEESKALKDIDDFIEKIGKKVFGYSDTVSGLKIITLYKKPFFYSSTVHLSVGDKRDLISRQVNIFCRAYTMGIQTGMPREHIVEMAENLVEDRKHSSELQQVIKEYFFDIFF